MKRVYWLAYQPLWSSSLQFAHTGSSCITVPTFFCQTQSEVVVIVCSLLCQINWGRVLERRSACVLHDLRSQLCVTRGEQASDFVS